jgi:dissimilatory sulfite reductase (desulfoviridin) alpha/beta subunit
MIAMTDTVYCYHCRKHHPANEVQLVQTKAGKRWRCVRSIHLCRGSRERRDAFGQSVSEFNRAINAWMHEQPMPHCVREVFSGALDRPRNPA